MNSMRFSRRDFLNLSAGAAAGTLLAACMPVGPAEQEAAAETEPAAEKIEIFFSRHGSEADLPVMQGLFDLFAAKRPDITVKPFVLPWNDFNTKLPIMIAAGDAPDIIGSHAGFFTEGYYAGGYVPIDDYIAADPDIDFDDIVFPGDTTIDGKVVGLPYTSCGHMFRYNKGLFAEAGLPTPSELYWEKKEEGWNMNSFVEIGKQMTEDMDGDGEPDQYFFGGYGGTSLLAIIRAFGGDIFDEAITKCTVTEQPVQEAIQYVADLVQEHGIQPPPEMQAGELGITFNTGKIAVGGTTTCDGVKDLLPDRQLAFEWDFIVVPAGPAGFNCWGDTGQMNISSTSPHPDACYAWMRYRSSREIWEEAYDAGTTMAFINSPTRYSLFESKSFLEPMTGIDTEMIKDSFIYAEPQPYVPRSPQPFRVLFSVMTTEVDNAVRGAKTVDEATADACEQIEAILAEGH